MSLKSNKQQYRNTDLGEEHSSHYDHKKKALINANRKPRQEVMDEFGFDDEIEMLEYQRYIK